MDIPSISALRNFLQNHKIRHIKHKTEKRGVYGNLQRSASKCSTCILFSLYLYGSKNACTVHALPKFSYTRVAPVLVIINAWP